MSKVQDSDVLPPVSVAQVFSRADNYDMFLMTIGTLGAIGSGVMMPLSNVLFGNIMDELNGDPDTFQSAINRLCIAFCVIAGISFVCGYYQVVYWTTAGERQAQKFREAYVNAIMSQEIGWFDTNNPATLSTKLADLIGKVQDGIGRKFGDFIFNVVQFFASIIISFYLSWKLSLVLLVSIPIVCAAGYYLVITVTAAQQEALQQYAQAGGLATQTFTAIRTVNALNLQPMVISQYRRFLYDAMIVGIRKGVNVGLGNGGLYAALFLTNALCYWYGGELVADSIERGCSLTDSSNNCITGGDVMAVFFCLIMGSMALGQAVPPLTSFSAARLAIANMQQIIERKPLINSLSNEGIVPEKDVCRGNIEIEKLEFAYPSRPDMMICRNYSLSIKAGETVAFVGASGCGKSTIINLLLRFYDPLRGSIRLDGYNVKDLNIRWLRGQIGYIGQEPALFPGSIAENIAYGLSDDPTDEIHEILSSMKSEHSDSNNNQNTNKNHSRHQQHQYQHINASKSNISISKEALMDRIIAAAKAANAHDFISRLPDQYHTNVGGVTGNLISGGQKQRIAIARALIKQPSILLLDEATSALDAASERIVQQSIDALATRGFNNTTTTKANANGNATVEYKKPTIIIVAHRLSTIRNADKICVLQDGVIQECGRHNELVQQQGLYADLVRLQMGELADGDTAAATANTTTATSIHTNTADTEEDSDANRSILASPAAAAAGAQEKSIFKEGIVQNNAVVSTKEATTVHKEEEEAEPELSKERSKMISRRIWTLIFQNPAWIFWGFSGALLFGGVFPLWGYMISKTQEMFYQADPADVRDDARLYGLYYLLFAGVSLISSVWQYAGLLGMGEKLSIVLRSDLFEAYLRQPMGFFDDHERHSVGQITQSLSEDCRLVHRAFSESFARQMQALCNLLISLVLSFTASWKITLIILATFPLIVGSSAVQMQAVTASQYEDVSEDAQNKQELQQQKQQQQQQQQQQQVTRSNTNNNNSNNNKTNTSDNSSAKNATSENANAQSSNDKYATNTASNTTAGVVATTTTMQGGPSAILSIAFTQMRTVSAFSMHQTLAQQYHTLTQERCQARIDRSIWGGLGFGAANAIQFAIYALLFWYGAVLMRTENLSFVNLMISIFALMMGALGLGQALTDMGDQKVAFLAADRIFTCIDAGKNSEIDGLATTGALLVANNHSTENDNSYAVVVPTNSSMNMNNNPDTNNNNNNNNKRAFGVHIQFQHVSFCYPHRPHIPVAQNYDFEILPGQTVAFVGPSGSGKSTIMNLLLRFYHPQEGRILIDGLPIEALNIRGLRQMCGYVGQEAVLFPGTVAQNISYGRNPDRHNNGNMRMLTLEEAILAEAREGQGKEVWRALLPFSPLQTNTTSTTTSTTTAATTTTTSRRMNNSVGKEAAAKEENKESAADDDKDIEMGTTSTSNKHTRAAAVDADIVQAAQAAFAHDFITQQFPLQYDTPVGDNAMMVSGGQKQRLAIARALIKQPRLLLLDEATSALDANSERMVQQSIDALATGGFNNNDNNSSSGSNSSSSNDRATRPTIIIIAHRLATIRNVDRIFVVDQGVIVEQGSHDELLADQNNDDGDDEGKSLRRNCRRTGLYRQLWDKQQGISH